MRRSLSGLVLGLALTLGSFSWAGFVLRNTVLNPSRSEAFANQVVDNSRLRSALTARLADGLSDTLPTDAPVPRQALEAAAGDALAEPTIVDELKRALVAVHQNALNGVEENVTLDASVLGSAARNQLVGDRPELDSRVPASPEITVELPTSGLSFLGKIRNGVGLFTLYSAALAVAAGIIALIVAKDRPKVLRRVAFWAFGTAAFWLAVGIGVPLVANVLAPSSAALVAGAIDVFFGAMVIPAIFIAGVGGGLLVVSALWPNVARRRPSRAIHSRPVVVPEANYQAIGRPAAGRGSNLRDPSARLSRSPEAQSRTPTPESRPVVTSAPDPTHIMPADMPRIASVATKSSQSESHSEGQSEDAGSQRPPPEWKPGVGYIDQR